MHCAATFFFFPPRVFLVLDSPRIPIKLSGMNENRSDSTHLYNIPYLKPILVAVHEFLLASRQAGGRTG
jgi:hypothetical protein